MNGYERTFYKQFSSKEHYQDFQLAVKSGRLPDGTTTDGNLSSESLARKTAPVEQPSDPASLDKTGQLHKVDHSYPDAWKYCHCETCQRKRDQVEEGRTTVYDTENLQKKAVAKIVSDSLASALVKLPNSPLRKAYQRTLECSKFTHVVNGNLKTDYCKCRWCLVCNRNRTAELIEKYVPIISSWDNAHFLTLTIPNCSGFDLEHTLDTMHSTWTSIKRLVKRGRKRATKTDRAFDAIKFQALRKIECTYNIIRDDFHPHYHFIIDSKEAAELILEEWLKAFPEAERAGQDLRSVDRDNIGSIKEMFKYFTKLFSSVKDKNGEKMYSAHVDQLDVIFQAMKGKRTLQPYGFKASDYREEIEQFKVAETIIDDLSESEVEEIISFEPEKYDAEYRPPEGLYKFTGTNWEHQVTGKPIVEFEPSEKLLKLIDNIYIYGVKSSDYDIHPMDALKKLSERASPG